MTRLGFSGLFGPKNLGLDPAKIRMVAPQEPAAGVARVAGPLPAPWPSHRRSWEILSARPSLPTPRGPWKRSVRQPLEAARERIEDWLVPGMHHGSESALQRLADFGQRLAASITRMRCGSARALEIGGAHTLEEGAVLALESIEGLSLQPFPRDFERAIEHQRAVGNDARVRRGRKPLDQVARHALPRSLVRRGRIGEAVADHPGAGLELAG